MNRVAAIQDRNERNRTFSYDINDNRIKEAWDNGTQLTYTYDKVSNLKTSYDATSNTTNTYDYDAIYQLTDKTTGNSRFHYNYDVYGDITQREDWINGSQIATLDYTYNKNHQLRHLKQTGTGVITQDLDFSYDRLSQLTKIDRTSANDPKHLITDYQYTAIGLLSDINNYVNTTANIISNYHYEYDAGNRLILTTGTDGNSAVDYGRDNQLKTIDNATRASETYDFNALGIRSGWSRVTGDSRRVLNDGKYEYRYDDEGNLTQKKELLTGNLTTYEWDYRNRLSKVTSGSQIVEYGYDAEDKRVSKKLNGVTTEKYVYDGADIALVLNAAGTLVERYLYGDGTDNVLSRERSGAVVWSLGDRQGSVVDLVNQDGTVLNHFVYDGFGTRTGTTAVDFRHGYTGRELDSETGLYYYRARYYDSKVGRFISEDPIGFSAGDTNLYRYVGNNSPNYTDPTGTLISGWAEDLLLGADQFAAGFGDAVTFGLTTKLREQLYGKFATDNHEGGFFMAGNIIGGIASFALGYGAEAQAAKLSARFINGIRTYDAVGTGIGVIQGIKNVNDGTATGWDLLNFLPAAGFAAKNGRKIGGAILKAGDTGANAVWRGIDNVLGNNRQPQLVLAGGRAASAKRADDVAAHQLAMITGGSDESFLDGYRRGSIRLSNKLDKSENFINELGEEIGKFNIKSPAGLQVNFNEAYDLVDEIISHRMTTKTPQSRNLAIYEWTHTDGSLRTKIFESEYKGQVSNKRTTTDGRIIADNNISFHSEQQAQKFFIDNEIPLNRVTRIYSEFSPCNDKSNQCANLIMSQFQKAEVFYSFDYSNKVAAREAKKLAFIRYGV